MNQSFDTLQALIDQTNELHKLTRYSPKSRVEYELYEKKVAEMTLIWPKYDFIGPGLLPKFVREGAEHYGDFDKYSIFKYAHHRDAHRFYLVMFEHNGNEPVFVSLFTNVEFNRMQMREINIAQTYEGFEGNNLLERMVFFMTALDKMPVLMDSRLSKVMVYAICKIFASGRFRMFWITDAGEAEPFTPETLLDVSKFKYATIFECTKWRIMFAENLKYPYPRFIDYKCPLSGFSLF